jgi:prolyl-tRNA editing enzyme YbaK/EbsC (Cys-tRNA(Pro) deacylase)
MKTVNSFQPVTKKANITMKQAIKAVKQYKADPVSPAELRRQVVEYRGKVSPIGAKLQAAVWAR